ncbi:MAG: hypothetical protein H6592_08095 [Flavobacteriales bacterium]|nr:hypothetical protein [Flavobacteriales bacterium]
MYWRNLTVGSIQGLNTTGPYDLAICALGFESRCVSHAASFKANSKTQQAIGFTHGHNDLYRAHKKVFADLQIDVKEPDDSGFRTLVQELLNRLTVVDSPLTVCVDISSFSRKRLGMLLEAFTDHSVPIQVDFAYSLAAFNTPKEFDGLTLEIGPITPRFSGWTAHPDPNLDCIVGLGFETGRAVGAIDVIEATKVHVFHPKSALIEYEQEVLKANTSLLDVVGYNEWINYNVELPFQLFEKLESMVAMKKTESSVVVFPFGPKVFALVSLLVGLIHPEITIWRISHGMNTPEVDRKPSGITAYLRVSFLRTGNEISVKANAQV